MNKSAIYNFILACKENLLIRDFLFELFTIPDRLILEPGNNEDEFIVKCKNLYPGKLAKFNNSKTIQFISRFKQIEKGQYFINKNDIISLGISFPDNGALVSPDDNVEIPEGLLKCYKQPGAFITKFGNFVMNYIGIEVPFDGKLDYINKRFTGGTLEDILNDAIIKRIINAHELEIYGDNIYFIGHMTELAVPAFTEKATMADPKLPEFKAQLLKKYEKDLKNNSAVAMTEVESKLIEFDKAWIKGDPSERFFMKDPKKSFNVQRKRMYLTVGMLETFGEKGKFGFIPQSLDEGWTHETFPLTVNELRKGSYERGLETAKGGEESKFLVRAFQNVRIIEEDCGTKRTMPVYASPYTLPKLLYRYALEKNDFVYLTNENIDTYKGKLINIRSPQTCQSLKGYCKKCMGGKFETLDSKGMAMRFNEIGGFFTQSALRSMHGSTFSSVTIDRLNPFLLGYSG